MTDPTPTGAPAAPESTAPLLSQIGLAIGILLMGGLALGGLVGLSGAAETSTPAESVLPVEVATAAPSAGPSRVLATGTVEAAQQVVVTPEVAGKLREVSDDLVPGGRFAKGDTLARIDGANYVAQLRAAEQQLEQARMELALEEGRGEVAAKEWALLADDSRRDRNPDLALRKPQLAVARAGVRAAEANLTKAQMDVGRTRLTAPFNAVVVSENVDVGQVVGASTQVATLVGTDRARITVSVPVDRIGVIDVPGIVNGAGVVPDAGSPVTVTHELADGTAIVRQGVVKALSGQLDPQTRTARVIVDIPHPLDPDSGSLPLLPGAFVSVEIEGRSLRSAIEVPRQAVRDGDTVWVVEDERLVRRDITVAWSLPDAVMVTSGLEDGDQYVVSALSNPLEGQRVAAQTAQ